MERELARSLVAMPPKVIERGDAHALEGLQHYETGIGGFSKVNVEQVRQAVVGSTQH